MIKREPYIDIIGPQAYHKINDKIKEYLEKEKLDETEFDTVSKFKFLNRIKNSSKKYHIFNCSRRL